MKKIDRADRTLPDEKAADLVNGSTTGERVRTSKAKPPLGADTVPDPHPIADVEQARRKPSEQNHSLAGNGAGLDTLFKDLSRSVEPPRMRKKQPRRGKSETEDRDIDELLEELPKDVEARKSIRRRRPNKTLTPVPPGPNWAPRTYGNVIGRRDLVRRFLPMWFVRGSRVVKAATAAAFGCVFVLAIFIGRTVRRDDAKTPVPIPSTSPSSSASSPPIRMPMALPSVPSVLPPPPKAPPAIAPKAPSPVASTAKLSRSVVPPARPQKQPASSLDTDPIPLDPRPLGTGASTSDSSPSPSQPLTGDERLLTGH